MNQLNRSHKNKQPSCTLVNIECKTTRASTRVLPNKYVNNSRSAHKTGVNKTVCNAAGTPSIRSLKIDISNISYGKSTSSSLSETAVTNSKGSSKGEVNISYIDLCNKSPIEPEPLKRNGKCLLSGALSKSMSDLGVGGKFCGYMRTSGLGSDILTPQVASYRNLLDTAV